MDSERLRAMDLKGGMEKAVRQYGRPLLGLFVLVLLVHNVFGTHGFVAMHRTQQEIRKVKAELERLDKENAQLEQEVKDLKSDPRLIEKIAREDLVLARPGETIIRLPAPQPPEQNPAVQP